MGALLREQLCEEAFVWEHLCVIRCLGAFLGEHLYGSICVSVSVCEGRICVEALMCVREHLRGSIL